MAKDYDRYELMKNANGTIDQLPFVDFNESSSDKYIEWIEGNSRMDILSQNYYGTPFYDWIILWANPEFISEFDIPDGTIIKIPFPLTRVLSTYQDNLLRYKER